MYHRRRAALAVLAAIALIMSTSPALSQEASPPTEDAAADAPSMGETAETSSLTILDVTTDASSLAPLTGKKYKKAVAKAVPAAARFVIDHAGDDAIGRIIGLSLLARAADQAGDARRAGALITIASLLYRNEWTRSGTDPVALNDAISSRIASGDYPAQDPALVLASFGEPGRGLADLIDICVEGDVEFILNPAGPSECADGGGRQVRADIALVDPEKNGTMDLFSGDTATADVGGVGIHKVVQGRTANDKLSGKQFKKALRKAINKEGEAIAGYTNGPSGVIEMVLAARAADEAGEAKAAKAFLALALAAYRRDVPEDTQTAGVNAAIDALIGAEYAGVPGLELYAPPQSADWCFEPDGETCLWLVGRDSHWECDGAGKVMVRLENASAEAMGCSFE